jgi:Autographiviridae endonuclease VII
MPWDAEQRAKYQLPQSERLAKARAKYAANPEKYQALHKLYYAKHKAKTTQRNWERQINELGCTAEQYRRMLGDQHGVCKLCGTVNKDGRKLAVDHCHKTGRVRGLLCSTCNTGLGCFGDDPIQLARALEYLNAL